ncbi:hypothetical protein COLO4_13741 [Corchorus olitorius]|uniref:Uncharacterized protein n=1 Tax=Corchorus olitorius TaxID=93759 RepID=A0A1R3JV41_9ROSI|nr:hypothetical protein COLO4_13741 [Corchorus olitorius]
MDEKGVGHVTTLYTYSDCSKQVPNYKGEVVE